MGLPPTFDDYAGGAACALCEDLIFDGKTPFYVEAWVFSVAACPGWPLVPPDGVFLLSQTAPCTWIYPFDGSYTLQWRLRPLESLFTIAFPGGVWFQSTLLFDCIDTFDNQNVCGVGLAIGEGGWVTVFWGPTIGP